MKLQTYTVGADRIGFEILVWDDTILAGNDPFKADSGDVIHPSYTEVTTIEDCDTVGIQCVTLFFGYKDWMCHRDFLRVKIEAIAGVDYSTWANLSTEEKQTALKYVPTKIINAQGYAFFVTESGSQEAATAHVNNYLSESFKARNRRYTAAVDFAYQHLGKDNGLKAEEKARLALMFYKFVERGILLASEDGVSGFEDWIQSQDIYATDPDNKGLLRMLNDGDIAILATSPYFGNNTGFCNAMVDIVKNGLY